MKRLSSLLSIALISVLALELPAQDAEKRGRRGERPAAGQDAEGQTPQGRMRPQGNRDAGNRSEGNRGLAGPRGGDPAAIVTRLMKEFDKDEDQKLDATELTALLAFMRDRGGQMRSAGGLGLAAQRPGVGQRPGKPGDARSSRNRRSNDPAGEPGGDQPKRP